MAGCNCKKGENFAEDLTVEARVKLEQKDNIEKASHYVAKVLVFLVITIFSPLLTLAILWLIFRTLVLNKEVDIIPTLKAFSDKFKKPDDDDDDDEEDKNLTYDDVIMEDLVE